MAGYGLPARADSRKSRGRSASSSADSEWHDYLPPEPLQLHNFQELHLDDEGTVTTLAESGTNQLKVLALFDGEHWSAEVVPVEKTRFAWRGPDKTDWAATINSFFEWEPGGREVIESEESSGAPILRPGGRAWRSLLAGDLRWARPLRPAHLAQPRPGQEDQFACPLHHGGRGWPAVVCRGQRPPLPAERATPGVSLAVGRPEQPARRPRPFPLEERKPAARRRRPVLSV